MFPSVFNWPPIVHYQRERLRQELVALQEQDSDAFRQLLDDVSRA